jgi:hypothetical protein
MRGHLGDRKSRVGFRRRFGAATARATARQAQSPKIGSAWRMLLLALVSFVRLAQDEPAPTKGAPSAPPASSDSRIAAEVQLLLAKAERERAEASKANAEAAYWRKRAAQTRPAEQFPGTEPERSSREAEREELEIESLELGNLLKLIGLVSALVGLAAGVVLTLLGGAHLGGLERDLLSLTSGWTRF